ncbi:M4 family metallopeptidase [Metabacillus mangrovi]|nr:M4 family metallopeptidase [Metabacillus mangrovi]
MGSTLPSASALTGEAKQAQNGKAQMMHDQWKKDKGSPSFVTAYKSKVKVKGESEARRYIQEQFTGKIDGEAGLILLGKEKDSLGFTHYKFAQSIKGVPIDGAVYIVHTDKNGIVTSSNGAIHEEAKAQVKSVNPKLTKAEAAKRAWKSVNLSIEDTEEERHAAPQGSFKASQLKKSKEKSELVLYKKDGTFHLAYKVQLQFIKPYGANWQIYVDAESGSIVDSYNAVNDAASTGSGTGVLGDSKTLNTYFTEDAYRLYDTTKDAVVETYTADNGTRLPGIFSEDSDNEFTADNQRADVDAHYYAGKVYDYFYGVHGRNSYDDAGAAITSTVHYETDYNNAFWNGTQMVYGDGDGSAFTSLSGALDVVAHELTHAVTERSANLQYQDQSGALNESFSDVFGYFLDPSDYLMGEDVYTPGQPGDALRSISSPETYDQPGHMDDYVNTSEDNGGVHINSGIPNKAFYYTNESIGQSASEEIYYRALTVYLTPTSSFTDARAALLQSAEDLFGSGSTEYDAVADAWTQVGVE